MVSATTGDRVGAKYYNVSSVTNETAVVTFNSTRSKLTVSVNTKLTRRLTKVFDLQWETETKDVLTDYFM